MQTQLGRDVSERLELVHVLREAPHVAGVVDLEVVDELEHPDEEVVEELVHHAHEVHVSAAVVDAELLEQVSEDLVVLAVQHAVRLEEHLVQALRRAVDQLFEELWGEEDEEDEEEGERGLNV